MKKVLLLMFVIVLVCSCEIDDNSPNAEYCWECIQTQVTSTSPSLSGYPSKTTTKIDKCGLTQGEADEVKKSLTSTTTTTVSKYTVTIKSTCVCTKKR